jgi:hypothetical protein
VNESNLSKILGGIKYLPASAGIKVLEKVHPMFKNYFSKVTAYGLDASRALDYLSSRFSNSGEFEQSLASRNPDQLRSDERIAMNEIAASKAPGKALRNVAALGTGLSLGSSQEAVPSDQNIANQQEQKTPPSSPSSNFIAKHPELGAYLDQLIKSGMAPEQAAAQAKTVKKLQPMIQDIEQSIGQDFVDLISSLFSGSQAKPSFKEPSGDTGQALNELKALMRQYFERKKGQS